MTIGSFVCTSCSGMLRGLTPPHRVKSISMASFSPEEVEVIKSRGNEYCRRIWLGLYDANHAHDTKDEQQIKDFMVSKYEKKRYYLEPSAAAIKNNGSVGFSPPGTQPQSRTGTPIHIATPPKTSIAAVATTASDIKPLSSLLGSHTKSLTLNVQTSVTSSSDNMFTPDKSSSEFLADFGSADPFSSSSQVAPASTQPSFANFENNPIFNSSSMPTSATLSTMSNSFSSPARKATSTMGGLQQSPFLNNQGVGMQPPKEDRYAALKDLDSLMKTQQASSEPQLSDWSAAAPAASPWSVNGPSMVSGTVYGSPSQAGFLNAQAGAFPDAGSTANPFTDGAFGWGSVGVGGMPNGQVMNGGLPAFHSSAAAAAAAAAFPTSQSLNFPAKTWHANPAGNPFVLGASPASTGHSSNPFL